ncbi:interleukin-15 receptor subunit alpha isoform X3 [Meles meles]|uniref:interleukin-15 receptor subunit alpha isoform X3 n=1 Tax=Meles meles TaxID=9662 RepID=UPI001E698F65|nr:interleukin-15 receptor subunit alpha isoform X3 [Meles meles]
MAPRPPSGCRVRALPAPPLLLSLLLLLLLQPATPGVTCPPPMSVEHADIRVKNYSLKSRERYTCNSGFKRKAGTSSLTECVFNETMNIAHWTVPNLKCISTYSYHSGAMTAVIGIIAVAVLCVVLVVILVCYGKSRHTAQTPSVEMESMEEMPMTRGTNGREEDAENYPHDPGHSRERLRAAEAGAKAPTLP